MSEMINTALKLVIYRRYFYKINCQFSITCDEDLQRKFFEETIWKPKIYVCFIKRKN